MQFGSGGVNGYLCVSPITGDQFPCLSSVYAGHMYAAILTEEIILKHALKVVFLINLNVLQHTQKLRDKVL